jgi:NAD(P)-dependent dehydrogenase (short-subunit alcohol dehydrogenase family)
MTNHEKKTLPKQEQHVQPGIEAVMNPLPESINANYKPAAKLLDKVAIITGGDSGIGKSVALHYALEGANVVIVYLNEIDDALATQCAINKIGKKCLSIAGDLSDPDFCKNIVEKTMNYFSTIDILINNAAEQHGHENFLDIMPRQLEKIFRTNIFSMFYLTQAVMPYLKRGSSIINTTSVTAYKGSEQLIDYSATKGAIVTFTRSLSAHLIKQGIRVNAVAPGPIWTPLIPASFSAKEVETFGSNVPMQRPGQPDEVAPCYVFLASDESSYMTGQVLHPNGGVIVNG